jgi:DNA repair exonuclease SbcCD ATPase subunit
MLNIDNEIKKINEHLKDQQKCIDDLTSSLNYLDHVKKAAENKIIFDVQMDKYIHYLKTKEQHTSSLEKHKLLLQKLQENLTILNNQYEAAIMLKNKISEAQGIALSSLVDTINIYVQPFLDLFFDEPMVVHLSMFKEDSTLKKPPKPKVTINLYYKGVLCPQDLSSLSSGEYARVSLAFTLSFHQINNNRFSPLMLDERTANLDQDLSTLIYSAVKETFSSQLILVVAHQVITGPFDNVMTL